MATVKPQTNAQILPKPSKKMPGGIPKARFGSPQSPQGTVSPTRIKTPTTGNFPAGPLSRDPGPGGKTGTGPNSAIFQGLQGGTGSGITSVLSDLLGSFQPGQNLELFANRMAPFMAGSLGTTGSYNQLQNFNQFNDPRQAFGGTAGQIAKGAEEQKTQGLEQLGKAGLGRSSARAAVAGQAAGGASNQISDLFSGLHQQSMQQRFSMANTAFDTDRMITAMALGMNPDPRSVGDFRQGERTSKTGQVVEMAGGAVGSIIGALGAAGI